jgi:REP element-mobilizing transposase RayT
MVTYTDLFTPNLFFVTNRTVGGDALLTNAMLMRVLGVVLTAVKKRYRFRLVGHLFLPNEMQLLLEPTRGIGVDQVMTAVQQGFQSDYHQVNGMPGTMLLWEKMYRTQHLKDEADFAQRLDAIHYAPVQQGWVDKPEAWPYSSYRTCLAQGLYPAGWGWKLPGNLPEKGTKENR